MMTPASIVAVLVTLVACVTDLRARRIPNWLTFGSALVGLVYGLASGGFAGLLHAALGWIVGAAVFFLPFALGGLGAGDVKLLAALGAWLGPGTVIWVALYTGAAGGVMAIAVALARGYLSQALANVRLLLMHWRVVGLTPLDQVTLATSAAPKLAYALPISVGTMIAIWLH